MFYDFFPYSVIVTNTQRGICCTCISSKCGYLAIQGRRRFLKSGTAIGRHRRGPKARAGGEHETRAGGEHERGHTPSRKEGSGDLPREMF